MSAPEPEQHPAWRGLEAAAISEATPAVLPYKPGEHAIELSKAISLKRIADALTGTGENMLTMPLNAFGENIGSAIAGQIARGMRGDDR